MITSQGVKLYEGKAKVIFATQNPKQVIVYYKDDATAFNGEKKAQIDGKGLINNQVASHLFTLLEKNGIETHFIKNLSQREQLVKRVEIIPLEVIMRNRVAGSMAKRYGVPEGQELASPTFELCYKRDDLGDPLINDSHVLGLGFATQAELTTIKALSEQINKILKEYFLSLGILLIDFKLEFGRYEGRVILADEISGDTCRFWDAKTLEKLDKDRFRRDMGGVVQAYANVAQRMGV